MKNVDMEQKIKQAFEHAAPNVLESVLSDCHEQKGAVIIMKERKNDWGKKLIAAAAAVALTIGLGAGAAFYRLNRAVAATVSLDVNPSVELSVNRKDRVLAVSANNEDGKTIIGNMDLAGSDLEVAVNAIVGSMLRNGYLNELANSVLVSVDSKDAAISTALQEKLAQEISVILASDSFDGAVISQTVEKTENLTNQADQYHISLGKASLIQQIIRQDNRYNFEDLADRSINELKLISQSPSIKLEHTSEVGNASEKEYIGREEARLAALMQLEAAPEDISEEEIEMDFENGAMIYEVDLTLNGVEFEFEIDAKTGDVLKKTNHNGGDLSNDTASQSIIDAQNARKVAFDHAGVKETEAKNVKCELDRDDGIAHYDVEFDAGKYEYDYEIEASTGKILKSEKEKDDDVPATQASATEVSLIGKDKAKEIALSHAGLKVANVRNLECDLDEEDGKRIYEVEFDSGEYEYSYEIDATSGKVISQEKERDD